MTSRITDGVFAMHKPPSITSAQVLRDLQDHFNPSEYFASSMAAETARRNAESNRQKKRRRDKSVKVKLGHGGTLDPLATGILICGVGKGTKDLPAFLGCKKTYETVVLFGASTDTYDCLGKVVARAPYQHITREAAEKLIKEKFLGEIKQRPPIFSALRINGKHAYEYAREGKELPRELAERDMKVDECEILEWYQPGGHSYTWPLEEAPIEEKEAVKKVYSEVAEIEAAAAESEKGTKRTAPEDEEPLEKIDEEDQNAEPSAKRQKTSPEESSSAPVEPATAEAAPEAPALTDTAPAEPTSTESAPAENAPADQKDTSASAANDNGPAAVKIRLTVSSGFYVRSFCHDLGLGLGSLGLMSSLVRSRQGDFNLEDTENVMEYADIEQGEEAWSAKLNKLLGRWPSIREKMVAEKTIDTGDSNTEDTRDSRAASGGSRDRQNNWRDQKSSRQPHWKGQGRGKQEWRSKDQTSDRKRHNTSSPEP